MPETFSYHPSPTDAASPSEVTPHGSSARWWAAVAAGTALSLPIGWLLSYAAPLLFLIGLFFFVLLGLVLGAVMYRVSAAGRPYASWSVLLGTTVVVAACWGLSFVKEVRDVPDDLAEKVVRSTRDIGALSVGDFRTEVAEQIHGFLRERYPPGGIVGTVRWIITSGELRDGDIPALKRTLHREQRGKGWVIRVVLSIAMLGFGIGSQTFSLRKCENRIQEPSTPSA